MPFERAVLRTSQSKLRPIDRAVEIPAFTLNRSPKKDLGHLNWQNKLLSGIMP